MCNKIGFLIETLHTKCHRMPHTKYNNHCPVMMFKFYISKLNPESTCLWQKPKRGHLYYNDEVWHESRVGRHNPLERFMKHMSKNINLHDQSYTNHATVLNEVYKKYRARHAMALS